MLHQFAFFSTDGLPPPYPQSPDMANTEISRVRRVLVVDDEPLIADTLVAILNEHGFEAVGVYGGTEAIEVAGKLAPEILLSDVLMPKMSGIELAIRVREGFPGIAVFLFSGQAATSELMRKAAMDGHHFELLPKPIHPQELVAKLKEI